MVFRDFLCGLFKIPHVNKVHSFFFKEYIFSYDSNGKGEFYNHFIVPSTCVSMRTVFLGFYVSLFFLKGTFYSC